MSDKDRVKFTVIGAIDHGKCFKLGTPIRLFDNTIKRVEDITISDSVIGVDGDKKRIVDVHRGKGRLYKISQQYGEDYTVNAHHVLVLKLAKEEEETDKDRHIISHSFGGDLIACEDIVELSVEDYIKLPESSKNRLRGFKVDTVKFAALLYVRPHDWTTKIEVSESEPGDYVGFQIEGNGRFLAPDFTVWHNSTMCGQLLAKSNWIDERSLQKVFENADRDKMTKSKWARVLDIFEEEQLRGKTHEDISIPFDYDGQSYELVDTPGHLIFIREMIAGISGVQICCLVLSMINNEFESSFERGTMREHLIIAKASGIEKIIILANKMDAVSWDKEVFEVKCKKVITFLKKLGYSYLDIITIPISAWLGVGLCDTIGMPKWYSESPYNGGCLLEALKGINCTPVPLVDRKKGQRFIIDTRIANYESIMTIGFTAVFHIGGEEYDATLEGIKDSKFIKTGDKSYTIWRLGEEVTLSSDRVIIRKDSHTIGLGKVVKSL